MSSVTALWTELEQRLLPVFADYRGRLAELPIEVKADRTLLTEADIAVQALIVDAIRAVDPDAVVIAEEDERTGPREEVRTSQGRIWVVDPIDGTAEFVQSGHVEFCSVVCLLEDWQPAAAFVLAPELGSGGTPILVTADARTGDLHLNGQRVQSPAEASGWLSATRSAGADPEDFDEAARKAGFTLKTRTTSQTVDMLRTAVDIEARTGPPLPRFDLFWRREQKLWDGAAGLCLSTAAGLRSCDEHGDALPLGPEFLSAPTPTFASTVTGRPETVVWFLEAVQA